MPPEPTVKRAVAFVDGQNLFHAAREAFGYTYPNYDILGLANAICGCMAWDLLKTRFYTGVPDASDDPFCWIKAGSAFPSSSTSINRRGIEKTDWIRIATGRSTTGAWTGATTGRRRPGCRLKVR